jgi:phosphate-selective porin OprO/OprP
LTLLKSFLLAGTLLMTAVPALAQSTDVRLPPNPVADGDRPSPSRLAAALDQAEPSTGASASATQPAAPPVVRPTPAAQAPPVERQPVAGFQDGFFIQSPDGDYRLLFGLVAQLDGRFSVDDPLPIINTLALRKVRPTFSGRVAKYFEFKLMPDFGSGTTVIQDAYFDIRFSPKFRVRTGKDKAPVGYEMLIRDTFLFFPERSLASNLVPNRDESVAVQGDLSPRVYYSVGIYNGVPDGASSTTDVDSNQGKDVAGRIVVQPFRKNGNATVTPFTGLGFHVGGSAGSQSGALPTFKTSVGQTYFSYSSGSVADGQRTRVSPAVFYYYKAIGAFAEYMHTDQRVRRNAASESVMNTGWDVTGSFVLTGEAASDRGVKPRSPFDPPARKWGALQVLARYTEVHFDGDAFALGLVNAGSASNAKSYTLALNWYPASVIKYYLTYEHTTFGPPPASDVSRPTENVILVRAQIGI